MCILKGLINSMGKKTMQISNLVCPGFLSLFKPGRDLYLLPSYEVFYRYQFGYMTAFGNTVEFYSRGLDMR